MGLFTRGMIFIFRNCIQGSILCWKCHSKSLSQGWIFVPKTQNLSLQVKNSSPPCISTSHFPKFFFLGKPNFQQSLFYNLDSYNKKSLIFQTFSQIVLTNALIETFFNDKWLILIIFQKPFPKMAKNWKPFPTTL